MYSLGVLAYELLTGALPYPLATLPVYEAVRVIREEDPRPISAIDKTLRGDAETIVTKALAKEKERRYASASALSADLRRYLSDEPIAARPPTAVYQLRKFAKRNRGLVSAAGESCWRSWRVWRGRCTSCSRARVQTDVARAAEKQAELAAERAEAVNEFLVKDLIGAASPNRDGHEAKVLDVMARATRAAGERFQEEPVLEGEVRYALGSAYGGSACSSKPKTETRLAVERFTSALGADHPRTIAATGNLATVLHQQGRFDEVVELVEPLVERASASLGPEDLTTVWLRSVLGGTLQTLGRHAEALPMLEQALELQEREIGPDHEHTLSTMSRIVGSLIAQRRLEEARRMNELAIERSRQGRGPGDPATIAAMNSQVTLLLEMGELAEAAPLAMELHAQALESFPPGHPGIAYTALSCGHALLNANRAQEAELYALRACELFGEAMPDRWEHERAIALASRVYDALGDFERAEPWKRRGLHVRLRVAGPGELENLVGQILELEQRLRARGRGDEAAVLAATLADDAAEEAPPGHPRRARYLGNLGRVLARQGRTDEAQALLEEAFDALADAETAGEDRAAIATALAELFDARGETDVAATWRARSTE